MSWADDYLRRQRGADSAREASGQSFIGGFTSSAISAVPELFGADPFPSAEAFRQENPGWGLVSELVGGITPWGGVGALSMTMRGAKVLDKAMTAVPGVRALSAVDNPIAFGAVKELVRYSPVEIARLGVGLGATDTWGDYGNLLADVGLSTLITGGVGGIGGFFRIGGKSLPEMGGVSGAPIGLRPTFEYRMSRTPGAESAVKNVSLGDVQQHLLRDVFQETADKSPIPGQKAAYISGLEGGAPETDALMNVLFRPAAGEKAVLRRQPLMDKSGNWSLSSDRMKELLGGLSERSGGAISTVEDMAENMVFPRLVTVASDRAAGTISKALDESAMQWVNDGVMAGKEAKGGLHVLAVRLRSGSAPTDGILAESGGKIAKGDQWMVFKTDKPHLFAPEGYKLAKLNVSAWSKFKEAWRPSGMDDFANRDMDLMVNSFTPEDWKIAATKPKATAKAMIAERVSQRFAETTGLKDSATIKQLVDQFFVHFAPTVVNERRNPLFARLFGTLRSAVQAGESIINRGVRGSIAVKGGVWSRKNLEHSRGVFDGVEPIEASLDRLTPDELIDFYHIGTAQAPAEALEQYTANGLVSDNLRKAIENVQAFDRKLWETHLSPAFKNANLEGKFDLLNGYIMPRLWTGDYFAPVVDEFGNLAWLANGTRRQAMHQAEVVVKEAQEAGRKLQIGEPYMLGAGKPVDQIGDLHDLVQMQMGKDAQMQEIVQRAMKRIAIDRTAGKGRTTLPRVGPPKSVLKERTGVPGSPDVAQPTKGDILKAVDNHYKQLMRFAAVSAWRNRFYTTAQSLPKASFDDLIRKQNQMMGYEGQITATLNKVLSPILGHALGGKAATKIASGTNELLYAWNLGIANPTFALLNVLQPIQTVMPHLAFLLRAPTELIERDMHMTLRFGADGLPREVVGVLEPARILGRAMKLMGSPDDDLKELLGRAKNEGTLMAQLFENFVGGQSRGLQTLGEAFNNAGGGVAGSWEVMKRGATFFAERSEEVSRLIAFNSYYVLGKDYLKLSGDQLYRFAKRGTHNSMFGYSLLDRSRIFTGPVGSMFGLFKNWQMHFISSMFQYANLGMKQGVWAPLIWQFGAAGAVGGIGAMGPLKWVADSLAKWHDGSPNSYLWMQENWHEAADELYFGFPALFGASLQASAIIPGTDVRNDLTSLSNFVFVERAKAAGKAVGAAWDFAEASGQNPLRQPNIRDQLMQAFAPRALFRAFASVEGDYIKSMSTGYPQVRDVSPLSKFLYGMGLNQVEVDRQQVAARELWKDQQSQRTVIQQLGIGLANAQLNGDYEGMQRINALAMAQGVPVSSVYKSARTRLNREQNQDIMSRYRGDMAARYVEAWKE